MQTTTFNPNFSIFDKKFIPQFVNPNELSQSIDMEPLSGNQFWPKQHKSSNKLKIIISKAFKSIKRKIFHKNHKGKKVEKTMASKITYHETSSIDESMDEIDETFDIYSLLSDENGSISLNIAESVTSSSSSTLAEKDLINRIENDSTECNTLKIKVILYEGEERTPIMIHASRNLSCCELKILIEQRIGYSLCETLVFVHVNDFHGDSIEEHYERIYDINFLNYLNNLRKISLIDCDFKLRLYSAFFDKIEFLLVNKNQLCRS